MSSLEILDKGYFLCTSEGLSGAHSYVPAEKEGI